MMKTITMLIILIRLRRLMMLLKDDDIDGLTSKFKENS